MDNIRSLLKSSERDCYIYETGQVLQWRDFAHVNHLQASDANSSGHWTSALFPELDQLEFYYKAVVSNVPGLAVTPLELKNDQPVQTYSICGEYWSVLTQHLLATRSSVKLIPYLPGTDFELDDDFFAFDMFLAFASFNRAKSLADHVILHTPLPYGLLFSFVIPAQRPFVFLQTFSLECWLLILACILLVSSTLTKKIYHITTFMLNIDLLGLFLRQPMILDTVRGLVRKSLRNRLLLGLWFLIVTLLSNWLSSMLLELMTASREPYSVNSLDDLLKPPFHKHRLIARAAFSMNADYLHHYRGGEVEQILIKEGRLSLGSEDMSQARDPDYLHALTSQNDVAIESMIVQMWHFWQSAIQTLAGNPHYDSWDTDVWNHLDHLHITNEPVGIDIAVMPFGSESSAELRRSYEILWGVHQQEGLMNLAMEEKPRLVRSQIAPHSKQEYEQLLLKDFYGPLAIYGICITWSFCVMIIEKLYIICSGLSKRSSLSTSSSDASL